MKISIGTIINFVVIGFILVWILFVRDVSHNSYHLHRYMSRYIIVSILALLILILIVELLKYIRDNYV